MPKALAASLLEGAHSWAERGLPVFPIAISWNEKKSGTNKRPLTPSGHHDGTTDPESFERLIKGMSSIRDGEVFGLGAVPGAAGFVVFDLDRHGGPDGIAYGNDQLLLPTDTYRRSTGSAGEHRWLAKLDTNVSIGNVSHWDKDGVNVRADSGWVVIEAETPWGNWGIHPEGRPWEMGCAPVPEPVWASLTSTQADPNVPVVRASSSPWRRFDADLHLSQLHPRFPELMRVLEQEGATVLAFRERTDGEPYLDLTCDGVSVSATLGYVSPCGLNVFSAGWPGRHTGAQEVVRPDAAAPFAESRPLGPDDWIAKEGLLAEDLALDVLNDAPLMRDLGERLWVYAGGVWRPDQAGWVRMALTRRLRNRFRPAFTKTVTEYLLGSLSILRCDPVPEFLNVTNGLLDWETGTLRPHDPGELTTVQLPVSWEPGAACPTIEHWLADVLPADILEPTEDGPGLIWELIGYLCFSGNPLHKAILLLGSGRNGKGTFLRLVTALLGEENVSNVDLHSLVTNRFRAAELFGKVANIAGDLDGAWLESTAVFKAITGGDAIQAERKYGQPFDFRPFAVPVYSANKVFGTPDTTDGYLSRWLVIPFPHSFLGHEDRTLDSRLQQPDELEGLLVRAVEGLRAVMARGNFATPPSVASAQSRFADESDPIRVFLTDVSEPRAQAWVKRESVWRVYRAWCEESGQRKPLTRTQLYARLTLAGWVQTKRHGDRGFADRRLTVETVEGRPGRLALESLDD